MSEKKATFYALKPFFWEGKNIEISKPVKLGKQDAIWMLARNAVTETKPEAKKAEDKQPEK